MTPGDLLGTWRLGAPTTLTSRSNRVCWHVTCAHCGTQRILRSDVLRMRPASHRGCNRTDRGGGAHDRACNLPSTDPQWARWAVELASGPVDWPRDRLAEVRAWMSNRAAERRRALEPVRVRTWERVVVP